MKKDSAIPSHHLFDGFDEETKQCGICKETLPIDNFGWEGSKGYRRYECRSCAKSQAKIVGEIKKSALPPPDDYCCPICQRSKGQIDTTYGKNKKNVWVADHNHETKQFRGWLCHKCNLGLGNLGDDYLRCLRAADYLENYVAPTREFGELFVLRESE